MKNLFLIFSIIAVLVACGSSTPDVAAASKNEVTTTDESTTAVAIVNPNRLLTVKIDGMVCEMGCGGSIRKGLKEVDGVANCSFDYQEGRKTNTATIEFDKDAISADEIENLIAQLNDGQFKVSESNTSPLTKVHETSSKSGHKDDAKDAVVNQPTPVNMSTSTGFELPNILDLFSSFLTR